MAAEAAQAEEWSIVELQREVDVDPTTITYDDVARAAEEIRAATAEHEARLAKSRQAAAAYLRLEWNCDERQVVAIQTELEERVWNREELDAEQMVGLITRHGGKRGACRGDCGEDEGLSEPRGQR